MSALEAEAQRALSDIIKHGNKVSLMPRDIATLAVFAFKNAVIANWLNPTRTPFFTPAVRDGFRRSLTVPGNVQMWSAKFSGSATAHGTFNGHVVGATNPDYGSPWNDFEFYVFTYVAGHLAFQVLAPRWIYLRHVGKPLPALRPSSIFDSVSTRFWPSYGIPLNWPPPKHLGDKSIKVFTYRWGRMPLTIG